jgi:hypothetical protein
VEAAMQLTNPAEGAFPIRDASAVGGAVDLRSDTVDLPRGTRAIRISVAGILKATLFDGSIVQYPSGALAIGFSHPMRVKRVWAATTADGVYGEY